MTCSKDYNKNELSFGNWKISKKKLEKTTRVWFLVFLALCLAMAFVIIFSICSGVRESKEVDIHYNMTRGLSDSIAIEITEPGVNKSACQLINCTIECQNTKKIYDAVFQTLQDTDCEENIVLKLHGQRFPNLILSNRWKPANKTITSVAITNSSFSYIGNEAFNSLDFTKTKFLSILDVKLHTLGNGVLLGFANLHSLHLDGSVRFIERCFFQPIQASLVHLTLNANLFISGSENIFGVSLMVNLEVLDLSDNVISGSLKRSFFNALPNLKYFILSNSDVSAIDEDAFDDVAKSLLVLDLSHNLLVSLDTRPVENIFAAGMIHLYLLGNDWLCDCNLKPLIDAYELHQDRFGDVPYCEAPLRLYGTLLTNVTFDENCTAIAKSGIHDLTSAQFFITEPFTHPATSSSSTTSLDMFERSFKMACLSVVSLGGEAKNSSTNGGPVDYFLFSPPCHDFEVSLLSNNSGRVVVHYANEPINIIWFSEGKENFVYTMNGITIDYNCEAYSDPFLTTDSLVENCTYTFCLVPVGSFSITPFNCLPLHVPMKIDEDIDIWISKDDKQLTLGVVCLVFMCSMLLGGLLAYFGIKSYPDLLEGSNRVLMVKKSNQVYVSTITEGEYTCHKNSLKKKSIKPTPFCNMLTLLPMTFSKNVDEIKESSKESEDYYEMPYVFDIKHDCQQNCVTNKCAISPSSPPPLPKRNSDSTLYGSASDFISIVPVQDLSF